MKKYFILAIAMFAMAQTSNAADDTDTAIDQNRQGIENLVNEDNDWELKSTHCLKKDNTEPYNWAIVLNGIYFGIGTHNTLDVINNSFEFGLLNLAAFEYNTQRGQLLTVGVGLGAKKYSLKRPYMFVRENQGQALGIETYPEDATKRSSRLYIHSVHFPMMFRQELPHGWHLNFGGIINWNYYVSATNHYELDNTDYDICQHGLKQNKCTFDWMAGVSFKGLGLYCRYRPAKVLKNNYGPRIHDTWSMGITMGL